MPKPNPKDKQNQKQAIVGKAIKDIIPSSYPHVRDIKEVEFPQQGEKIYSPENLPIDLFPEWSTNETDMEAMQKSLIPENEESPQKYLDPNGDKIYLPLNLFMDYLDTNVKWLSPEKYITEIYLDKLIQTQMKRKNPFKFREKVHECYEEELKIRQRNLEKSKNEEGDKEGTDNENKNNSEESENDIEEKDEFLIYRDFFKVLDTPLNLTIVNSITRMETEEEMNQRIKRQEEELQQQMINDPKNKKAKKHPGKPPGGAPEQPSEKMEITLPSPNDIALKETLPPFSRWVGSIFQIIKDRNLTDVKTGESIWQKIYPQKNGVPIYNKNGHYIVKLYHMGKPRKIEIDDRMPVSINDEFFLPKCESLEEIWPAILTKALLKLYSYKLISDKYFEIGDAEPFYALTGYIPSLIKFVSPFKLKEGEEMNKNKYMDDHNDSKIIEIESKNSKSDNNNKDNENKNENKKNENEGNNNINEIKNNLENNNNNLNNNFEVPKEKIKFLENALIDDNYTNSNYLVECFRTIDKNFYKVKNDLSGLDEEAEEQIIKNMHVMDNAEESPKNEEEKSNKDIINNVPVVEYGPIPEIEEGKNIGKVSVDLNKATLMGSINTKFGLSLGKTATDYSMLEWNKIEFKRIHEKLEDYSMENNLFKGILYDIVDIFNNEEYNMNRLQPIDFSDLKAMLKNFNKNNVFKQLNRDEKRLYITNLKDIKEKQKLAKAQRIESLKLKGSQYYSVKIENKGIEKPSCIPQHDEQEIQMAKKCILNKWEFPPMDYLDQRYNEKKALEKERQEAEEEAEAALKKKKKGDKEKRHEKEEKQEKDKDKDDKNQRTWSKEIYLQLIENNLDQFKECKAPITRGPGSWIESSIFFNSFDNFLVLYNPSKYNTCFDWENYWENTSDVLTSKEENEILYFKPNLKGENENEKKNLCNYIVIMYETISDNKNKLRNLPYKIRFRFINKDEKVDQGRLVKIDSFYGSEFIDGLSEDSEYFLIFEGGIFPEGFYVKVISDYSITPLNYQNFLSNHQGFTKQTFHVEHNALQKNELYVLLRVSILNETRSKFLIISNNTKDKYANEFIKIYICDHNNKNTKKNVELKSFFDLNPGEYMLVMTIDPIYILEANSYDVDILSCSDISSSSGMDVSQTNTAIPGEQNKPIGLTMEQVESVAPYEITDNYQPNKKFILFKEFIFAGEKVNALLYIKKISLNKDNKDDENSNQADNQEKDNSKRRDSRKATKNINKNVTPNNNNNNNGVPDASSPSANNDENNNNNPSPKEEDNIRLKIELFNRENELIFSEDFYNEIILHNMIFEGSTVNESGAAGGGKGGKKPDKKVAMESTTSLPSNLPYRLICTIDITESPNKYQNPVYMKNIGWCIRVFSTDTLGFCQDTSKEDKERAIIQSWEEKEPGRAELAKKSRKRFLLQQKMAKNISLTEDESEFLKENRTRKTFMKTGNEEEKENDINKNKKGQAKGGVQPKKKGKENIVQDKGDEEKDKESYGYLNVKINYDKKTSKVEHHSSLFIKNFLSYAYDNRMITYNSNYEQEDKELNSEVLATEKEEKINAAFIESEKQNSEKMSIKKKDELKLDNKKIFDKIMTHRKKEVEECKSFYDTRTSLAMGIQNKIIVEKKIKDVLASLGGSNDSPTPLDQKGKKKGGAVPVTGAADLDEAINVYQEAVKVGLKSNLVEQLFDEISAKKEEAYKAEINKPVDAKNKNKDTKSIATKILNEINNQKWKISEEFIEELNKLKSA